MTVERENEIERTVFYRYMNNIMCDLEECENSHVTFNIGRHIGMMHFQLLDELDKERENKDLEGKRWRTNMKDEVKYDLASWKKRLEDTKRHLEESHSCSDEGLKNEIEYIEYYIEIAEAYQKGRADLLQEIEDNHKCLTNEGDKVICMTLEEWEQLKNLNKQ